MARMRLEQAYPEIAFRSRTRNWWARLNRVPAECVHLETDTSWMATFAPDTLYLRGKASARRQPVRPEVSLCQSCLLARLETELAAYPGRVVAFEPDAESVTQYFFVDTSEFAAAGLQPEVDEAIASRVGQLEGDCARCALPATWLWMSRTEVQSLDEVASIVTAPGKLLCAKHGAEALCNALADLEGANLFYVNVPYGESGAYLWI
jgi:hypothetical protein